MKKSHRLTTIGYFLGLLCFIPALPSVSLAKLTVITTTTDLGAIAREVGGDEVRVDSICKGTQDPHYIEAKPSFMTKVSRADLVLAVGLDLEIGWLPSILRGSRNPKVSEGGPGYLEVGPLVHPLEVPTGKISRSGGDVHPLGNPHVTLDPERAGEIGMKIAEKLGSLDSAHASQYLERARGLKSRMEGKAKAWQARVEKSGIKQVVSYHRTLSYFFDRFKLGNPAILEPKPGIPPTAGHTLEVINLIRKEKIPLILVENFFDPAATNRIKEEVPSVRVEVVPVAVDGAPGLKTLDDVYERLVAAVEGNK